MCLFFIINAIEFGYKLPQLQIPPPFVAKNNNSAMQESAFVEDAINKLIRLDCITEVSTPPTFPFRSQGKSDRFCMFVTIIDIF